MENILVDLKPGDIVENKNCDKYQVYTYLDLSKEKNTYVIGLKPYNKEFILSELINLNISKEDINNFKEEYKVVSYESIDIDNIRVGEKYVTKRTGPINIGTVCGIIKYCDKMPSSDYWLKLYPDYKEKNLIFLKLDKENYNLSQEEWIENVVKEQIDMIRKLFPCFRDAVGDVFKSTEDFKQFTRNNYMCYYEQEPKFWSIYCPEDDLEKI